MWYYLKKAGNILGAGFGLLLLWNFGVEYGIKITEEKQKPSKKKRVQRDSNNVTIDLSKEE